MKILALAATNHTKSINKQLVNYAASLFAGAEITLIDLNDFGCPMFSIEEEKKNGVPAAAKRFVTLIDQSDLVLVSYAEYNGSYTPVYKNLLDWASRVRRGLWAGKPLFFMATSPGAAGATTVLRRAAESVPFMGGDVVETFSLPSFNQNFSDGRITNKKLAAQLQQKVQYVQKFVNKVPDKILAVTEKMKYFWEFLGYGLFVAIVVSRLIGSEILSSPLAFGLWPVALYAATFTLIVKPLYDMIGGPVLQGMLSWRKGIGFISSGIVVGFWLNRYVDFGDISVLTNYFSVENWSFDLRTMLTRTSEITALVLLLISNKWMIKYANKLWRGLQKLSFAYFLSAAVYLYLFLDKLYALVCLLVFFVIYQIWIYVRLSQSESEVQNSSARMSQAS